MIFENNARVAQSGVKGDNFPQRIHSCNISAEDESELRYNYRIPGQQGKY